MQQIEENSYAYRISITVKFMYIAISFYWYSFESNFFIFFNLYVKLLK